MTKKIAEKAEYALAVFTVCFSGNPVLYYVHHQLGGYKTMKNATTHSVSTKRVCEITARIPEIMHNIDELTEGFITLRKLRPSYARDHLEAIASAIDWLRFNERELETLKANPDCPF